ncbi:hypothetical protein V8C34DRAFT_304354 [Trichoderma compactum]
MKTLSFLSALTLPAIDSASQVGASGTLSSLDGGLGGVVTVASDSSLQVTQYKLADASVPGLYCLTIDLDAGHSPADSSTVGL